jgi:hypothetical protein
MCLLKKTNPAHSSDHFFSTWVVASFCSLGTSVADGVFFHLTVENKSPVISPSVALEREISPPAEPCRASSLQLRSITALANDREEIDESNVDFAACSWHQSRAFLAELVEQILMAAQIPAACGAAARPSRTH